MAIASATAGCSRVDPGSIRRPPERTTTGTRRSTAPTANSVNRLGSDVNDPVFPGLGDPRIDVIHYEVGITTTPGVAKISGRVTMRAVVTSPQPLRTFTLDLRALVVSSASVNGRPAVVSIRGDQIVLQPTLPLLPQATFTVAIEYGGVPHPLELSAVAGLEIGWQSDGHGGTYTLSEPYGTQTWMPVSDHPSDKATFTISVDVPDGVEVVGNGLLNKKPSRRTRGRTVWTWEEAEPMAPYLALVAVGQYDIIDRTDPTGLPMIEAYPEGGHNGARRPGLDRILATFREAFGAYPFSSSGLIVVPADLNVALETQTRPMFGSGGVDGSIMAHELGHQWFGNSVTPYRWGDVWLSEGFATYAEWVWLEADGGPTIEESGRATVNDLGPSSGPAIPRSAVDAFGPDVYQRGAATLFALRHEIGAVPFGVLLRRWTCEQGGASASTSDFVALAGSVAGRDLAPFMERWLSGGAVPEVPR